MKLILVALAFALLASPAEAGPVAAAIGAIGSFVSSTLAAGGIGAFLIRTGVSIGLSLLAQALQPKPKEAGIKIAGTTAGEAESQAFPLGRWATGGHLVYRNSFGSAGKTPRAYLTHVIEVSDIPGVTLDGLIINDKLAVIGETADPDLGFPLTNITGKGGQVRAWVKFYDGTQTTADAQLVSEYGTRDDGYEWTANHIGTGIAYAILTFRYDREAFQNVPSATFILAGIPIYDPRKDSTVGGDGAHRWGQPSTHEPSSNAAVQVYNLLRGITMPTGEVYGGGVDAADVPLANAVAGMNICDLALGDRPQFETGLEVRVAEDEPADVIERILRGSLGQIAEVGGVWRTRFGAPASPVLSFTDDDISVSDPQAYEPIKGLDATFNGISGTYVEPADLWQPRGTTPLFNATWEAEDGNRRLVADVQFDTVASRAQAQQAQSALIADERRQRQHQLVLPPDAQILDPLDDVAWSSETNGYDAKDFEVAQVTFRARTGIVAVTLMERDPDDYDWTAGDDPVPMPPYEPLPIQPTQVVPGWAVTAITLVDADGNARRPAIRLSWNGDDQDDTNLLRWQVRLASSQAIIAHGVASVEDGQVEISDGILPATGYEARAEFVADRPTGYTSWLGAVTADVRFGRGDLVAELQASFDYAFDLTDGAVENIDGVVGDLRDLIGEIIAPIVGPDLPTVPHIARIDSDLIAEAQTRADEIAAEAQARVTAVQILADDLASEVDERTSDALAMAGSIRDVRDRIQRTANDLTDLSSLDYLEREELRVTLTAEVEGARAEYTQSINVLAGEQLALSQQVTLLDAETDDLQSQITVADTARVDGDTALASQIALLSVGTTFQFDQIAIWYWDETVEGWTGVPDAPTVTADGYLAPADGSYAVSPDGLAIDTQAYRQARARLRGEPVTWADAYLYWAAEGQGWDNARRVAIAEPAWEGDEAQITVNPDWSGTIDRVRIDLPDGVEMDWFAIGRPAPGASSADIAAEREARINQGLALASDISTLTGDLTTAEGDITGNSNALQALDVRVEDAEDGIVTLSQAQTALSGQIGDLETGLTATGDAVDSLTIRTETLEDGTSVQSESARAIRATQRLLGNQALDGLAATLLRDQDTLEVVAEASQFLNSRVDLTDAELSIVSEAVTLLQAEVPGLATSDALQALTTRVDVTEDEITSLATAVTDLQATIPTLATASALQALDVRVDQTEGSLTTQAGQITDLQVGLSDAEDDIGTNAGAITSLTATVTQQGDEIQSVSGAVTNLTNRVTTAEGDITAQGSALQTLTTRVTAAEGVNTTQSQAITSLEADISDAQSGVTGNADAITAITARVDVTEDDITSVSGQLTTLDNALTSLDGEVDANANAIGSLQTTVTQQGQTITAQGQSITALETGLSNAETGVTGNADAIGTLTTQVQDLDGDITAVAARTTTLESEIQAPVTGALARIDDLAATRVTASGAVAAVDTEISAEYGSLSAMASATSFAEATVDGIIEGFVWRTGVGGLLELVSVDDGTDGPVTTAQIAGDYILLDGDVQVAGSFLLDGSAHLQDASITNAKIGDLEVGRIKISAGAVSDFGLIKTAVSFAGTTTYGSDAFIGDHELVISGDPNLVPERFVFRPRLSGFTPSVLSLASGQWGGFYRIRFKRDRGGVVTELSTYIEPFWQFATDGSRMTQVLYAGVRPSSVLLVTDGSFQPGDKLIFEYYWHRFRSGSVDAAVSVTSFDLEVEEYFR